MRSGTELSQFLRNFLPAVDYNAEGCWIESRVGPSFLRRPISNWVRFSNHGGLRKQKERDGLCVSYASPKIQLASNLHCSDGH